MRKEKKPRSLRTFMLVTIGVSVICFIAVMLGIFLNNMSQMLQRAEHEHLEELSSAIKGSLVTMLDNLHSNTRTWSSWDEPYAYAIGENDSFIEDNLYDGDMLSIYHVDFLVIKDRNGNDLFAGSRSEPEGTERMRVPDGLSERITPIAADVLEKQDPNHVYDVEGPYCDVGFVVVGGQSYMVCVMPILRSDETGPAAGTFTFAVRYGSEQIEELTRLDETHFYVYERDGESDLSYGTYEVRRNGIISMSALIPNRSGRDALLGFDHPRGLYTNGWSLIMTTLALLFATVVLIMAVLFFIMHRCLLRPLGRLISDVGGVGQNVEIDSGKYAQYQELHTLSLAINGMLQRLEQSYLMAEQSKVSLNVLTNILNGLDAYLYVSDPVTDEILFINDNMKQHFNLEGEGVGQTCWKVLQSGFDKRCEFCPCHQLEQNPDHPVVVWEEHNTVTGRHYRNTDRYIDWIGGKKVHLQHSVDITDISAAKELAEQASRSKSEFLSRMSHEMRTPMNAIIGMTNIAKSSNDPSKKEYCLERIDNASRHLLGVINDILDMSKIEANKFELSHSEFSFERMLRNVIDVISFRMDEKHQKFSLYIDPAMPATLVGDEQRLSQVIANLLTNAAKFTPEHGSIQLRAGVLDDENGALKLRVEVADSGIGISREQQARLFHSFEQADGSIARKFGGTGLGLAISKRIVELMGGRIWVESELGNGSKFIFTFNAHKGENGVVGPPDRRVHTGALNIMAVDDSPEVREYFAHVMDEAGARCTVASGGHEALELFKSAPEPFDIVFVDWKMPGMNGVELTRELRKLPGKHPIIIMISVAEWSDIEDEATRAGVDGFVPKPLFPSLLMDCIHRHLGAEPAEEPEKEAAHSRPSLEGKAVLLAEDVDINREIIITVLEDAKLAIECAENGQQAVEMFAADPGKYDVILMDIHMPEVDGLEATRRIRALPGPEGARIPIVAMTADVFHEDIQKCMQAGMNDHIGKPVDFDELLTKLRKYLR